MLMPMAGLSAALGDRASVTTLVLIAVGAVTLVMCMLTWSIVQVRRGRWQHIDASARRERAHLNRVLLLVFAIASSCCALLGASRAATALLFAAGS
ncbi:MAG: hypothetical protein ABI650_04795, partial [Dokdonella sp.]